MSIIVPLYLQAKNLVAFNVSGCNADANGTLVFGTPTSLSVGDNGTFVEFKFRPSLNAEAIRPSDSTFQNMAAEFDGFECSATQISVSNGLGVLQSAYASYDYIRFEAVYKPKGSTGASTKIVVVGIRGDLDFGVTAGKNTQTLSIQPCSIPPYLGTGTSPI